MPGRCGRTVPFAPTTYCLAGSACQTSKAIDCQAASKQGRNTKQGKYCGLSLNLKGPSTSGVLTLVPQARAKTAWNLKKGLLKRAVRSRTGPISGSTLAWRSVPGMIFRAVHLLPLSGLSFPNPYHAMFFQQAVSPVLGSSAASMSMTRRSSTPGSAEPDVGQSGAGTDSAQSDEDVAIPKTKHGLPFCHRSRFRFSNSELCYLG